MRWEVQCLHFYETHKVYFLLQMVVAKVADGKENAVWDNQECS